MFCIAAFIILCVLSVFSARYRTLVKKAWYCVTRKLTFRKCDIRFDEEIKGRLLGSIILTRPRLAKFLAKWMDMLALLFVILSVWSLAVVFVSGLNLLVYDTCNPQNSQSCSLSGEACSVGSAQETFLQSVRSGRELTWAKNQITGVASALSLVPSRFKNWKVQDYAVPNSTYFGPFDPAKPLALEVIDPGCMYCAKLFQNIQNSGFENKYNLTYLVYPIPDASQPAGYKFKNSYVIAQYLEATKQIAPARPHSGIPPDWQLLQSVFTGSEPDGTKIQNEFNLLFTRQQAITKIHQLLLDFGYQPQQLSDLDTAAQNGQTAGSLARQKQTVEKQIHTVKIPTIMFGGRRYDRVLTVEKLQ